MVLGWLVDGFMIIDCFVMVYDGLCWFMRHFAITLKCHW